MSDQILVPTLGESITEATVSKWLKRVGEEVDSDEPIVELETDKVNVEVPSPMSGTLTSIKVKEGSTVEVGALLGTVEEGKSESSVTTKKNIIKKTTYKPPKKETKEILPVEETPLQLVEKTEEASQEEVSQEEALVLDNLADDETEELGDEINETSKHYVPPKSKKSLSPAVRKMVEENNINIENIMGSGKDGRISIKLRSYNYSRW